MQPRWRRIVAMAVGLWFTASVSGVALQLCPEHGSGADMTMHHGGMHHPDGHGQRGRHDMHDDCTCTGMCCVTGTVTLPARRLVAIPVVPVEVAVIAPLPVPELAPHATPDYTLPPPLGPPAVRA